MKYIKHFKESQELLAHHKSLNSLNKDIDSIDTTILMDTLNQIKDDYNAEVRYYMDSDKPMENGYLPNNHSWVNCVANTHRFKYYVVHIEDNNVGNPLVLNNKPSDILINIFKQTLSYYYEETGEKIVCLIHKTNNNIGIPNRIMRVKFVRDTIFSFASPELLEEIAYYYNTITLSRL